MSEHNKAFVRHFFEVMDQGNWEQLKQLMHPDHLFFFPLAPEPIGRDAHVAMTSGFAAAFSGFEHVIADQISEADKVVTRGVVRARHTGEFIGLAPTGNDVEFGFINIMRIEEGMNREEWDEIDGLRLMRTIGAIPGQ